MEISPAMEGTREDHRLGFGGGGAQEVRAAVAARAGRSADDAAEDLGLAPATRADELFASRGLGFAQYRFRRFTAVQAWGELTLSAVMFAA